MRFLIVALVLAAARTASAGMFCGIDAAEVELPTTGTPSGEPVQSIAWIEAFAKDKSVAATGLDAYNCAATDAVRLRARIEAACTKILDRDGDTSQCVVLAATAGLQQLGKHDIFPALLRQVGETKPLDADSGQWHLPWYLAKLGDPRGTKLLVDMWTATIPQAEKRAKSHEAMVSWSSWRQVAAHALGVLGTADDATFLREQAKATVDSHVRDACNDAATAIDKRQRR